MLNLNTEWSQVFSFTPQTIQDERRPSESHRRGFCASTYHCKESNHDNPDVQPIFCSQYGL